MNKPFQELAVGGIFIFNGTQYTKIDQVKVSCCKSINAVCVDNNQQRVFIQPQQEVEISE